MSDTQVPIRATDSDEVIEASIEEARANNVYEHTLVVEAPENALPIRATEVPRDSDFRERAVTPISQLHPEDRRTLEEEVANGPYVGPIDGEGTSIEDQGDIVADAGTGGRRDREGNLLFDPGITPGYEAPLPGLRDEDGNLIADHDGDGKAAAHEGPIREAIGSGASPDESEADSKGGRGVDDPDRDLSEAAEEEVAPEHDPDASEEEQKAGRGLDDRDLGDAEGMNEPAEYQSFLEVAEPREEETPEDTSHPAGGEPTDASPGPAAQRPGDDAAAFEWRDYARANGVQVGSTDNKAKIKSALREAGVIQ